MLAVARGEQDLFVTMRSNKICRDVAHNRGLSLTLADHTISEQVADIYCFELGLFARLQHPEYRTLHLTVRLFHLLISGIRSDLAQVYILL